MITGLDHVALVVRDLDAALTGYGALLGREADWVGRADGVRQAWFQLPNMALDLIAPEGDGAFADRIRAHLDAHGEGLWAVAFSSDDLAGDARLMSRRGLAATEPATLRTTADDGAFREWAVASLDAAATAGVRMLLVGPSAQAWPVAPTSTGGVSELDHIVIRTSNCDRALGIYGAKLGLDLRLDRANESWGVRQLFFRCGSAVVEFGASLKIPVSDAPDGFGGLAWRVLDADAAQARLSAAGFDVSEVRAGRKPGTRVFTLRAGVPGAPALIIQQNAETAGAI